MVTAPSATASRPNRTASTSPLTDQLVRAIGDRWCHGDGFRPMADQVVDVVAEHIRSCGIAALDPRIGDAIADAIRDHHEHDHAPTDAPGQQLLGFDADEIDPGETIVADIYAGEVRTVRRVHAPRSAGCPSCVGARRAAKLPTDWGWCAECDRGWRGSAIGGAG